MVGNNNDVMILSTVHLVTVWYYSTMLLERLLLQNAERDSGAYPAPYLMGTWHSLGVKVAGAWR